MEWWKIEIIKSNERLYKLATPSLLKFPQAFLHLLSCGLLVWFPGLAEDAWKILVMLCQECHGPGIGWVSRAEIDA